MKQRDLPLRVFHFDCFWMREFEWCDFEWDPRLFPDPEGMLQRLHSAWSQDLRLDQLLHRAALAAFCGGCGQGIFPQAHRWLRLADRSVAAGHGDCRFHQPSRSRMVCKPYPSTARDGRRRDQDRLWRAYPDGGVVYHDGSDPVKMHNFYPIVYNETVFRAIEAQRGQGEVVLFARSSYASGQRFPVHWGGDCWSTFESMAEILRGGLSLSLCGFGFWSHDIGGFEGTAPAHVYKRWAAFGLLSSHSRLHGSSSYRVPWAYDEEACDVLRLFTKLKCRLMPYLWRAALEASREGVPVMRAMLLEFPDDSACDTLDRQYMLGEALLVAPVFTEDGSVEYYLPAGSWTNLLTGQAYAGPGWRRDHHDFFSLPLMVRPGTILPLGAVDDRPDYDYVNGVTFRVYELVDGGELACAVTTPQRAKAARLNVRRNGQHVIAEVSDDISTRWQLQVAGAKTVRAQNSARITPDPLGTIIQPADGHHQLELELID